MKIRNLVSVLFLVFLSVSCEVQTPAENTFTVHYASKQEAEKLIAGDDDFSKNLNQFDLDVRLQKTGATKEEWERLVKQETREWSQEELARMEQAFDTLEANVQQLELDLPFPEQLVMVKTTMNEEMGAGGYTRKNWIAIGEQELERATDAQLTQLLGHELFHVLSRYDADFKKKVYHIFGFESLGKEIAFAEDIQAKRITNPDISRRDSYIPLMVDGKQQNCVQYLYADHAYDGGNIFDCLKVGFIPLDAEMHPVVADSGTVIYPLDKVANEFQTKIGKNTGYVIDPEEISAEHFSFLVTCKKDLPNPEFIEAMRQVLQK